MQRSYVFVLTLALLGTTTLARADNFKWEKFDTEYLFGFITGTDIGEVGEKEFETETNGRFGKRTGSYSALSHTIAVEYVPVENLRLEPGVVLGYHNISAVSGLDDVRRGSFQGFSFDARYRLVDRERSGLGLTLQIEPRWSRVDETTGQPVNQYGADLAILLDKELIPNRVIGAFNLLYSPGVTQSRVTGAWSRDATLGASTAFMVHVQNGFYVGAEARYLRAYDSLNLDGFAGHALFVGPNIFFRPAERWRITAAWSFQVAGKAISNSAPLDLTNFERQQVKLRIGYQF